MGKNWKLIYFVRYHGMYVLLQKYYKSSLAKNCNFSEMLGQEECLITTAYFSRGNHPMTWRLFGSIFDIHGPQTKLCFYTCLSVILITGGGIPGHPPKTATEAGGTHHTGMHSCFVHNFPLHFSIQIIHGGAASCEVRRPADQLVRADEQKEAEGRRRNKRL